MESLLHSYIDEGVQVVEWVGLVVFFRAVFAEEVCCFGIADQDDLI
jgi:hypothetical protein